METRRLKFVLITAETALAQRAERAGVGRIMVDLERMGKLERQKFRDTWISKHRMEDIRPIADVLSDAELMVRIDPLNDASHSEIDNVIEHGAQIVMLPMFRSVEEVRDCARMIDGRAHLVPLIETAEAFALCGEIAACEGVSECFIGLNDLHLSLGHSFMFETMASGSLAAACDELARSGKPYGFGGIARIGEGDLPAELILREHARLGSTRVILSRTFARSGTEQIIVSQGGVLRQEIAKLQEVYQDALRSDTAALDENHRSLARRVAEIVQRIERQKAATE